MRTTTILGLTAILLAGCGPVRTEDPLTTEVRTDYAAVEAMGAEPVPPPAAPLHAAANYAYQGGVRYPAAWIPTILVNTLPVLLGEVAVAGLIPFTTTWGWLEPQDEVDDFVYAVYKEGVNIRKMWNMTPQLLDDRYDLVESNRREGIPPTTLVPPDRYPSVESLVPPKWDAPSRSGPRFPGPEEQPK